MGRDTVQMETAVSTISQEYLLEFMSEYGISEALHPELPGPGERIMDFPEGKVGIAPKNEMPAENTYSTEAVMVLNTHRTPIQKQLEALLCLVGLSHRYFLRDEVYPTFVHDDDRDMDLFNLIRAPNPTKVKTSTRPYVAHEVPLLTVTASRVIETEDPTAATDSSGVPSTIERSPLDFANENPSQHWTGGNRPEDQGQEAVALEIPPPDNRGNDGVDTNAPPKVLRRDHADFRPTQSTHGGKSFAAIGLGMGSTRHVPASGGAPVDVSDPDPLSFADPQTLPTADVAQSSKRAAAAGDPESKNTFFASMVGSPESIYRPDKYNINLAGQVVMGSQLRLRFEQEAKLLKKSVGQVARQDKRIQARENEIKNLKTLLEAETDMKKTTEGKRAELSRELENLRALFSDRQRCAEMDARLDALSIDFDEELYPHMLTAIVGRRWVIGHGLRLAVMKCGELTELRQVFADIVSAGIAKGMSEGIKYEVENGKANLSLEAIEAYDSEAESKYIAALHALKDLKYPMVDQLKSLKDAPIDVIMVALHLESDTRDDAPQWIRELHLSSSQLRIPVYPEKKCRVVCRRNGVGSAHHAISDGVPVSMPTVAPQGLAILLADAATQMEISEDGTSPRLLRSSSLPVMHN
uniref:Transposase (Putative), gypsy type n=1 Tax=Tanacetum cinerariifolium TaxID=118510 RepID=A0A6L2NWR5_TANCI|nr:hypothetical protein [Tanacetum cinerariifolium]